MLNMIRRAFRSRFPLPEPPRVLSGEWTPEERSFVVSQMRDAVEHQTQGRFRRLPEDQKFDFRRNVAVIESGSAEEIGQNWPFIRIRYQVNGVLQDKSVKESHA
jgi:hypothetical protein